MLALLADVHGNLTALDAALADMAQFGPSGVLCLGDVASFGPQPRETLRRLRALNPRMVMGNTDASLLAPRNLTDVEAPNADTAVILDIEAWSAAQLEADDLAYVRTFAPTLGLELAGLSLLAYHGSPRSYDDPIRASTPDELLDGYFSGEAADLYLGGHTHEPFVRRYYSSLLLNPGSVGLSFVIREGKALNHPVAEYALLDVKEGQPNLQFRRVPYDLSALVAAVKGSAMPHQERWLADFRPLRPAPP